MAAYLKAPRGHRIEDCLKKFSTICEQFRDACILHQKRLRMVFGSHELFDRFCNRFFSRFFNIFFKKSFKKIIPDGLGQGASEDSDSASTPTPFCH